ncbi:MAG: hypothetical protein PHX43_04080 [Alphaproteobacteria bacterium]|nr:hypothetical protein [Alphaproteobacteria bacterium]
MNCSEQNIFTIADGDGLIVVVLSGNQKEVEYLAALISKDLFMERPEPAELARAVVDRAGLAVCEKCALNDGKENYMRSQNPASQKPARQGFGAEDRLGFWPILKSMRGVFPK